MRIDTYIEHIKESLIDDKILNSNNNFKRVITYLEKHFKTIEQEIEEWEDSYEIDNIKDFLIDINDKIFDTYIKQISRFDSVNDLENLFLDTIQYLSFKKDSFINISDKNSNESFITIKDYETFNESLEDVQVSIQNILYLFMDNYITTFNMFEDKFNKISNNKQLSFDDKREKIKELFYKISKKVDKTLKNTDFSEIDDKVRSKSKMDDIDLETIKPGTKLLYKQLNGDENTAEVANNQEGIEDGYINLMSTDGKETFIIKLDNIIGYTDDKGELLVTPDYIEKGINDILDDDKKMRKLKKFIDNL